MKCLSIRQPWATLVVSGLRRQETRGWRTSYRGPLAIHASSTLDAEIETLCRRPWLKDLLRAAGFKSVFDLPRGQVLGVVELVDIAAVEEENPPAASNEPGMDERRPGMFVWKLAQPRRLLEPLRCSGKTGVFDIPDLD